MKDQDSYERRNMVLKSMGFDSYAEYLESHMWKSIKGRVAKKKGDRCQLCGEHAECFHHSRYHEEDLRGGCLDFIHPVCNTCHDLIEIGTDGKKLSMEESSSRFRMMKNARKNTRSEKFRNKAKIKDAGIAARILRDFIETGKLDRGLTLDSAVWRLEQMIKHG